MFETEVIWFRGDCFAVEKIFSYVVAFTVFEGHLHFLKQNHVSLSIYDRVALLNVNSNITVV